MTTQGKRYPATVTPARQRGGQDWLLLRLRIFKWIGRILIYVILAIGALIFSAPLLWMISTSLKPEGLVSQFPIVWIPPEPKWSNFFTAWNKSVPPFTTIPFTLRSLILLGWSSPARWLPLALRGFVSGGATSFSWCSWPQ